MDLQNLIRILVMNSSAKGGAVNSFLKGYISRTVASLAIIVVAISLSVLFPILSKHLYLVASIQLCVFVAAIGFSRHYLPSRNSLIVREKQNETRVVEPRVVTKEEIERSSADQERNLRYVRTLPEHIASRNANGEIPRRVKRATHFQ